jgi:hypothetical protein
MKVRICVLVVLGLFYSLVISYGQSNLIHYWHFNNTLPADGSGGIAYGQHLLYSDYSETRAKAAVIYCSTSGSATDTGFVDNVNGGKLNERDGFGGCCAGTNIGLRLRNPSYNMQFLWYAPAVNYKNIVIKYITKSSSFKSGMHDQVYSYSIDSGKTFITNGLTLTSVTPDTVWGLATIDLRAITKINDNSKFVFKIVFLGNNTGAKGNNRFDNITLEGDIINPNLVKTAEINTKYILYPSPAEKIINLKSGTSGDKKVSIYNSIGVQVYEFIMKEKLFSINVENYSSGLYFINIKDIDGWNNSTLKFIKK